MDDPWGSPWATNDSNLTLEPPPRASTTLELPGRTLVRQSSSSNISPWAREDDGLGDWGSAEVGLALPQATATPGSGWTGWGGDNGLTASQTSLTTRAREGSLGLSNAPAWPTSTSPALGQGKTLSRRSSARSLFRQASPDPWATEVSENRLSLPAVAHISAEQGAFTTLERHSEEDERDVAEPKEEAEGLTPVAEDGDTQEQDMASWPTDDQNPQPEGTKPDSNSAIGTRKDTQKSTDSPGASRHSSVSSESHREERLDSPITSMDEDAKDCPQITRRPSTKVQELVHMFDGLTKEDNDMLLVPGPTRSRHRSRSRSVSVRSATTDAISDFGDFEDAADFDTISPSSRPSISGSPQPPNTRCRRLRSSSNPALNNAAATISASAVIPEEYSDETRNWRSKFGSINFSTDMALVDQMFDVAKLDNEQPSSKDYSLDAVDGIIKDSFTAVSERKMWYRISRPGTLRRHNMGDDDNYRRVTWAGSKVREDTTKIVRRWMEEDSVGRPALGGGSIVKSGGFNWDSKAEPMSFDQIFGKRKSVQPTKQAFAPPPRPLSLQSQSTTAVHSRQSSLGVKSLPPRSPLSIPAPTSRPTFGWSTEGAESVASSSPRPSSQFARPSLDVPSLRPGSSRAPSIREPESRSSLQIMPPVAVSLSERPNASKGPIQTVQDEEDDDEWGEMVASPAESHPASALFDASLNGSFLNLGTTSTPPLANALDTGTTLNAVSTKLDSDKGATTTADPSTSSAAADSIWDFSAFDSSPALTAIPPTITSKPEFDFDTPLQSPTLTIPSRTGSPASVPPSRSPTPTVSSLAGSPASFHVPKPSHGSVPLRPQHSSKSSLSLARPSPLQNVIIPKPPSPTPASAVTVPTRAVSFAVDDDAASEEEVAAAKRIVAGLPDLSYMLQ